MYVEYKHFWSRQSGRSLHQERTEKSSPCQFDIARLRFSDSQFGPADTLNLRGLPTEFCIRKSKEQQNLFGRWHPHAAPK